MGVYDAIMNKSNEPHRPSTENIIKKNHDSVVEIKSEHPLEWKKEKREKNVKDHLSTGNVAIKTAHYSHRPSWSSCSSHLRISFNALVTFSIGGDLFLQQKVKWERVRKGTYEVINNKMKGELKLIFVFIELNSTRHITIIAFPSFSMCFNGLSLSLHLTVDVCVMAEVWVRNDYDFLIFW